MRLQRWAALAAALMMGIAMFAGCRAGRDSSEDEGAKDYPVTVGGTELKKAPERVVVLSPSLAEIACDMGYDSMLCARADECDAPAAVANLPSAGGMLLPDVDKLKEWQADAVLTQSNLSPTLREQLDKAHIPLVVIPAAASFDDLSALYVQVGQFFAGAHTGEQNGRKQLESLQKSLKAITLQLSSVESDPLKVLVVTDAYGHVATGETLLNRLIAQARGSNAAENAADWTASEEQLAGAEVIFCPDGLVDQVKAMKSLAASPAVKNGRVYGVSASAMERQSLRMVTAVRTMAFVLYPDAFNTAPSDASQTEE